MKFLLGGPAAALAWLGRQGTRAVALSIFVGLLVPGAAAAFKPWLGETVFALLCLAFLRVEPAALREVLRRPALVLGAAAWVMLVLPVALGSLFFVLGLGASMPGLYLILILQLAAPALMSSPALAALMGLDVALTLAGLILSTIVVPISASAFTHILLGTSPITPLSLGSMLFAFIAGSALTAAIVRGIAGRRWIEAQRERIDGLSVVGMFVFAMAAMDGIVARFIADPGLVLGLTALTFALSLGVIALTTLVFLPAGRGRAFAIGILAGNRNIGVMLAAIGFAVPDVSWLYFGLAQFPIYLLPQFFKPLAKRFTNGN